MHSIKLYLSALIRYRSFILVQVTFITNQNFKYIVRGVLVNILHPVPNIVERVLVANVVD